MIGDEVTDDGGVKTFIAKIRAFEDMHLREFLFICVESTGTSEKLQEAVEEAFVKDIVKFTGLMRDDALTIFKEKLKGTGSDRASKMLKFAKLIGAENAFAQYNCDNHITESAWSKVEDTVPQVKSSQGMVSKAFTMQSNSANRKMKMKQKADEWKRKFVSLTNVLDIKFATYNLEASLSFMIDYPVVAAVLMQLINDSSVKPKRRADFAALLKQMADMRNIVNINALVNVLEFVADYQLWGQRMKASAFERKYAREKLQVEMKKLEDVQTCYKNLEKYFDFLDLRKKVFKKSGIVISHSEDITFMELANRVMKRQMFIAKTFLTAKNKLHAEEDPKFLDGLSDVFDVRNWNISMMKQDDGGAFDSGVDEMMMKLKENSEFFDDLNLNDVLQEFQTVMHSIRATGLGYEILVSASKEDHIIDQWTLIKNESPMLHQKIQELWFRLVKRASGAPNAQTEVERSNSVLALFKNELSATMKIPMMRSRLRIKENGPSISIFNPGTVRRQWISEGHKYAQKVSERDLVIERIRKPDEEYNSKIFQ